MVFSSITFLFYFLPIFIACYFLTPTVAGKNVVTLIFSLVFYAWGEPRYIAILLFAIVFNYAAAIVIDRRDGSSRKSALGLAVAVNLLVLGVFKYANFVTGNFAALLKPLGWDFGQTNIELPLGISFFTFHCLSYIIDVYRRRFRANRDPVDVALYISLFPQLVAGPIVRYKTVARQLDARHRRWARVGGGAHLHRRIRTEGACRRRRRAAGAGRIDQSPHRELAEAWIGLMAYTVQIYFDFAGYSNMAIGLGVVLGFTFPRNFRMPYTSLSITEFGAAGTCRCRRGCIATIFTFRLAGTAGPIFRPIDLVTVFVLCGAWHGANWTFVLRGVSHGPTSSWNGWGSVRFSLNSPCGCAGPMRCSR